MFEYEVWCGEGTFKYVSSFWFGEGRMWMMEFIDDDEDD